MGTMYSSVTARLEENVIRFFSPNALLTVVALIFLSVLLFGGSGIEHRMMDRPTAEHQQATISPILHTAR